MIRLGLFLLAASAAAAQTTAPLPARVQRVFTRACAACHNPQSAQGKLRLDTLEALAGGGANGPAIVAGNPDASAVMRRLRTNEPNLRMPPAGAPLPAADIALIQTWIEQGAPGLPKSPDYAGRIEPILKANCYGCHSGAQPKSQLRLDARATALKGGLGGPVILPGAAEKSRLIARVEGRGGEKRMPLDGKPLTPADISALRRWIDAGAVWPEKPGQPQQVSSIEKHWAYKKPERAPLPQVKGAVRNGVDNFVLARLEAQGLGFQPEAPRETLIRRLSLDLTGLPPAPDEIDAFVGDTRADAYEQLVERLLKSKHYGERWARPWLDLARYADTNGYEKDRRRTMWPWRDWVINALNADMGFDQFTIEQLAGDMLPNPTREQKIATGFHRNTMYNEEGGVDKEEAHFEVLVDRVNTTGTVFLGTSLMCTQCHNHKYDPFTQKEFYQLMAFFSAGEKAQQEYGDTSIKYREPQLDLATPDQESRRAALEKRIREFEKTLSTSTPELERAQAEWEAGVLAAQNEWQTLKPSRLEARAGATLKADDSGAVLASGDNPQRETYVIESSVNLPRLSGIRLEVLPHESLPRGGPGRDIYGNMILTEAVVEVERAGGRWEKLDFTRIVADDGRINDTAKRQLWVVDASRDDKRLPRQLVLAPRTPVALEGAARLRITLRQDSDFVGQSAGHFRLSATAAADPSQVVKLRARLRPVVQTAAASRTEAQGKELAEFYRSIAPALASARDELKELRNQLDRLGIVSALILEDKPGFQRPFDFVRTRGGFAAKADKVYANVPAALHPLPESELPNRLGLARWLASKENPLTPRVTVNRIWDQYFGRGIVETAEDFGNAGLRPSHPELLDWLAVELMDRNWSMKALHRLIVTSAAYRQSSHVTPEILAKDPYNKLLSRGPRFRLEAEMIRDLSLTASGLLSRKVGGPSVFPPQPPGVWDIPYSDDTWKESTGEDRYRRGLYTFVRRSAMYPAMLNFDATSREVCTVRRIRTNTPLQALTTLNDEAFFETARALAGRILREGGATDRDKVDYGFRLTTGRHPRPGDADRAMSWLERERAYFAAHSDEAKKLFAGTPDGAAWTMLSNVLLNLDETLTKE